ncbi:MAG: hypothetical protein WBX49_10635, partial [Candidatus Deferrimicrobiaceae bacterium]
MGIQTETGLPRGRKKCLAEGGALYKSNHWGLSREPVSIIHFPVFFGIGGKCGSPGRQPAGQSFPVASAETS